MQRKIKMVSIDSSSTKSGIAYFENGILMEHSVINYEKEKDAVIRCENMSIALIEYLNKKKPFEKC